MDAIGSDNQVAISDALKRPDGQKDLNKVGRGGQTPLMHAGKPRRDMWNVWRHVVCADACMSLLTG